MTMTKKLLSFVKVSRKMSTFSSQDTGVSDRLLPPSVNVNILFLALQPFIMHLF